MVNLAKYIILYVNRFPALIASVAKSTKGRMRFKIRNTFFSNNPGRNTLAVNKASVTFCLIRPVVLLDRFDPAFEVSGKIAIFLINCVIYDHIWSLVKIARIL